MVGEVWGVSSHRHQNHGRNCHIRPHDHLFALIAPFWYIIKIQMLNHLGPNKERSLKTLVWTWVWKPPSSPNEPQRLMVFSLLHLPIVWLLHAALALCAGSVKFGWVGHGFNGRSWAGACAPRCKRLGHLVKCRAGGKGVLWLNGSRSVRVLQGGWVGWRETMHSNSSRHAC